MMKGKETQLQHMLTQLRTRLLVMAASVGIAVDEACQALRDGNLGRASAVMGGDQAIDALENEIDEMALSLLVRNQPVAHDLRFVVGALRMVIDLERIGDEAASIAERSAILNGPLPPEVLEAVASLMETAKTQYKEAVEVFRAGDSEKAMLLCRDEDEATQQEVAALQRLMDNFCHMPGKESSEPRAVMHGILICRALNRICRRSANIAEQTIFIAKGVNIRHKPELLK